MTIQKAKKIEENHIEEKITADKRREWQTTVDTINKGRAEQRRGYHQSNQIVHQRGEVRRSAEENNETQIRKKRLDEKKGES